MLNMRAMVLAGWITFCGCAGSVSSQTGNFASDIDAVMTRPLYQGASWGLRVVDANTGFVLLEKSPGQKFFIGSVRKMFSVGLLLNKVGADRTFDTPVFRTGPVDGGGGLQGNLVVVASGDLTMGGHRNPDGTLAIPDLDHNEANSIGNAQLTDPDPLAGFGQLADQIVAAGIQSVQGDVVVDSRLYDPFPFRGEFQATAMFVNDDVVDLSIRPTTVGELAQVVHRPQSSALLVDNQLLTGSAGSPLEVNLNPEEPPLGGTGTVSGNVPVDLVPPLTGSLPLVRTFRISDPDSYARSVLIEALQARGVQVQRPIVQVNNQALLPPADSYTVDNRLALLKGVPYGDLARWILKVSYNLGADNSLMLLGVAHQVRTQAAALHVERGLLTGDLGLDGSSFDFVDGSGGGDTRASSAAVTDLVLAMLRSPMAPTFAEALPILGVDGSLAMVRDFLQDASLAGAQGKVHAKTGTYVVAGTSSPLLLRGQALGGFVDTRSGRRLVFQLVVNEVPIAEFSDLLQVFQDQGTISAILWRDF